MEWENQLKVETFRLLARRATLYYWYVRWKVTHFDVLNKINVSSLFSRLHVVFSSLNNGPFWWLLRRRRFLWSFLPCEFFEHLWTVCGNIFESNLQSPLTLFRKQLSTIELCCDANTNLKRLRSWKKIGRHPDLCKS